MFFGPIGSLSPHVVAPVDVDVLDAVVVQEQLETTQPELGGHHVAQHVDILFCRGGRQALLDHLGRHLVHGGPGEFFDELPAIGLGPGRTAAAQNAVGYRGGNVGLHLAVVHRVAQVGAAEGSVSFTCSLPFTCSVPSIWSVSFTGGPSGWFLISEMESGSSVVAVSDEVGASSTAVVRAHLASVAFDLALPIAFPLRVLAPYLWWGMGGATSIVRVDAISSDEKPFSP